MGVDGGEFVYVRNAFIILMAISFLLISLRLLGFPIFRFDFELFIFHIPTLICFATLLYFWFKGR